jgi:hypothetical protein
LSVLSTILGQVRLELDRTYSDPAAPGVELVVILIASVGVVNAIK